MHVRFREAQHILRLGRGRFNSSNRARSVLPCVALTVLCALATANGCGDSEDPAIAFAADAATDAAAPDLDGSTPNMLDGSTGPDADLMEGGPLVDATPDMDVIPTEDASDSDLLDATGGDAGACDVLAQTGCEPSEKCSIVTERDDAGADTGRSIECVANANPLAEGENCPYFEEIDACGPGLKCSRKVNGEINTFVCSKFCDVDSPDCAVGERCLTRERFGDVPAEVPAHVGVCTEPCSVFTTSACSCTALFQNGDGVCFGGTGVPTEGELCELVGTACAPHLGCYARDPGDAGTPLEYRCYQYCNLSNPCTGDGGTQVCTPIQEGSALGICLSP